MKKIIYGCFIIFTTLNVFSQDIGEVYFQEPQPKNSKNEEKIPAIFHGKYHNNKDSLLTIIISADSIHFNHAQLYVFKRNELKEKGWELNEDGISGFVKNRTIPALVIGDTVYTYFIQSQTFFKITDTSVIKQHENILYINKKISSDRWITSIIKKENNKLTVAYIDTDNKNDKNALAQTKPLNIVKNKNNEPVHIYNMSKLNWQQYIQAGGCSAETVFEKK